MAGTTFPQVTAVTIASQARADFAPEIRKTSLDQESLPRRHNPSPDALNLIWFFVVLFGGLFVLAVSLRLFR